MKRKIKISRFLSLFLRKGLSLALSFIIHFILLGSMVYFFTPYKIYWDEKEVTDVMIAPREKLFIPPMREIFGETEEDLLPPQSSSESSGKGKPSRVKEPDEGSSTQVAGEQGEGQRTSVSGEGSFPSEWSAQFRFNLSSASSLKGPLENEIQLSPNKGLEGLVPGGSKEGFSPQKLNLGEYTGRKTSSLPGSSLSAFPVSPGRGSPAEGGGYNLSPWAEKVMDSVNKNWVIPSSKEKPFIEKVKITVVVQKNGKLLFMETTKSSGNSSFNRAALEALTLSVPFPVLPPDFPGETLQLDFVFDYVHVQD